ncbi:hypothetical protein DYB37_007471 [Aphanomyces astaci]|uniref:Conserved oligomeric Golgi complex subunit 3 C-terminal domain-containing protein n=1 Tax=Aphanomyces astaci TaxID=112090 RepID=A0A418F0J7_APHAT|nr:hypothetical protein DYB37_007471 [Aphanomyces astaci]
MSLKQYYALKAPATPLATNTPVPLSSTIQQFMTNAQTCYRVCETVEEHTEKSLALLQEMEDRHVSVKTLTSALYESFETLLTELDALNVKVQSLEGPLPYFTRISSIAKAVGTNESFLPDVLDTYVTVRTQLVTPVVDAYLTSVNQSTDIVSLLRMGCQYMVRLCQAEYTLFRHVFGVVPSAPVLQVEDQDEHAFQRMIFQLSYSLYHAVRPRMLQQHNLDVLCEIVEVLRREVVDTHIRPMGDAAEAVEPVVDRMIGDAQERLILCTQKYLRDEIEAFVPTLADLNYPDKLLGACATPTVYATWYPTLEHTLMCLSKVYRYVNMQIFEELAQDAVRMCTATLNMASADIAVEKGHLDGGLFLIKHLLTLRERITPFDIQFAVTEKNLDFSSTTGSYPN